MSGALVEFGIDDQESFLKAARLVKAAGMTEEDGDFSASIKPPGGFKSIPRHRRVVHCYLWLIVTHSENKVYPMTNSNRIVSTEFRFIQ